MQLTGRISLDKNPEGELDATAWGGIDLIVRGNGKTHYVHLRNRDTHIVWQSYRAGFRADPEWRLIRLPFGEFRPYCIDRPLVLRHLGLVASGRVIDVVPCVARVALYCVYPYAASRQTRFRCDREHATMPRVGGITVIVADTSGIGYPTPSACPLRTPCLVVSLKWKRWE